jgi:oligopeptide transport system ATP-binding protein
VFATPPLSYILRCILGDQAQQLLRVSDLVVDFATQEGTVHAVDCVSFDVAPGELVGLVGESGCGKSVTASAILGLTRMLGNATVTGHVEFEGRDLLALPEKEVRRVRGKDIAMIFQDPVTSLNPVLSIERLMTEGIEVHMGLNHAGAVERAIEMLRLVGIPQAERRIHDYPHQFSGGMRQRVMIAMALSCNPEVLIADEPTTALDVTIQAQILELIKSLSARSTTAVILITHDLGVVAGMCDTVCVMYAGRIVESAGVDDLFRDPLHPYTRGLLDSIPRVDRAGGGRLHSIPGSPPSLIDVPDACPFHPRCPHAMDICRRAYPPQRQRAGTPPRAVSCWLHAKEG